MVEEILKKEMLDEDDINILMKNIGSLPESALIRLGLKEAEPVTDEPVKKVVSRKKITS